ncbi:MAG TPA: hypothetical protein VF594_00665 [Rubricoccaceae bacterium]|jgi:hypothetical protein
MFASSIARHLVGLLAFASLVAAAEPAAAQRQRTERVRFAHGESEAYLTRDVSSGASVRYLVGASRGQVLYAEILESVDDATCSLQVYAPGRAVRAANAAPSTTGERLALSDWTGQLSRAGDYQVVVTNDGARGDCGVRIYVE